ncbi:MAG: S41 family peptidase, partial [Flavisolibacter sp.]
LLTPDSIHFSKDRPYKTHGGRIVYGGGGIMPDVFVPIDSNLYTRSVTKLYLDGRFNNFVYKYYIDHQPLFTQYKTPESMAANYQNTGDAWKELVNFAMKDSINLSKIPETDKKNIQNRIKAYLARLKWRTEGFYEVYNLYDPVVKKAEEVLSK